MLDRTQNIWYLKTKLAADGGRIRGGHEEVRLGFRRANPARDWS